MSSTQCNEQEKKKRKKTHTHNHFERNLEFKELLPIKESIFFIFVNKIWGKWENLTEPKSKLTWKMREWTKKSHFRLMNDMKGEWVRQSVPEKSAWMFQKCAEHIYLEIQLERERENGCRLKWREKKMCAKIEMFTNFRCLGEATTNIARISKHVNRYFKHCSYTWILSKKVLEKCLSARY